MSLPTAADAKRFRPRLKASDPRTWKPVHTAVAVPGRGVTLAEGGIFRQAMDANTAYLLAAFSVNDMLHPFRVRAGVKDPPRDRPPVPFWETDLNGSNAGRFLMGAGNTLKWMEHPELRRRLDALVDGIAGCQRADGYVYAFPPEGFLHSEQANYARNWFTQGMLDAAAAGNGRALEAMRRGHDWFNRCEYLPQLIYLSLGLQGHTSCTQMYFSAAGKPEDLQVAERYYVQDSWMDRLIARDPGAIWQYPLDRPHCYEITGFEAYLDHYLAAGERKILKAMLAAWDLLVANWEHMGGAWALCEGQPYPPKSYRLPCTGELCGSAFWVRFNQRLHRLFPRRERYVAEIEKPLYNVGLANLTPRGMRYHALLDGVKNPPNDCNTCCELMGTRLYGSLPEYIYSVAPDGIYVNLFEPSAIEWAGGVPSPWPSPPRGEGTARLASQGAGALRLTLATRFPFKPEVSLRVAARRPVAMTLRVRVPRWAAAPMPIHVNGRRAATGRPGSYAAIRRAWRSGDRVTFTLPAAFRMTRYTGVFQVPGTERWALEYGPILMAVVGPPREVRELTSAAALTIPPRDFVRRLEPIRGRPLHHWIRGAPGYRCMPYFQVGDESFSAVPVFQPLAILGTAAFAGAARVSLVAAEDADIRYTLDGADPTPYAPRYEGPFEIKQSCRVRARLFRAGRPASPVVERVFRTAVSV